jgi:integrase
MDAGIQASTLNRDIGALRACLSHKGRRAFKKVKQWCQVHPFDDLDPLEVVTENPRFLDRDKGEDTRLFQALEEREQRLREKRASGNERRELRGYELMPELGTFADYLRPMVLVLLHTGMRIGELSKLKWGAVDFPNERVTVLASTSKTKKPRTVPLNSVALQTLRDWRSQTKELGLVFSHDDGGRIGTIRKAFGGVLEEAKIENFTLHHLRHSFASWLVQDDEPIFNVSRLLGHASVATTQIYAHLAPDHSRAAVERLAGSGKW